MASIKVKFRPSTAAGHEGKIYYQIIHERKVRQLISAYSIFPDEWDNHKSMIRINCHSERFEKLKAIRDLIRIDLQRLSKIDRRLEDDGFPYTADDIIEEYRQYLTHYSLFNFMENVIDEIRNTGRIRTAETYYSALISFRQFREQQDVMLDCLTPNLMKAYEMWLQKKGLVPNSTSFYMRILRATYNRAVEMDIIENTRPFRNVYTGVEKTVKRALPIGIIRKIRYLDLSYDPRLDYARDMFILSFFLRGMSFIDMSFLRKKDLRFGHISYRRRKTGQLLSIKWTREMQEILNKYPENPTEFLLPIIKTNTENKRMHYHNRMSEINASLKRIAEIINLKIPLTLYVARHSWASVARSKGIPISIISEGMGHDSETTTQIYLASLDTTAVDRANAKILRAL